MTWTYIGSFVLGVAGVLVTIAVAWGRLNGKVDAKFETIHVALDRLDKKLEPLVIVPALLTEARIEIKETDERVRQLELEAVRRSRSH
jgi:hypothetical protein